jgi:acetone carboxylase gamma subunit
MEKENTINESEISNQDKTGGNKSKSGKPKKIKCYHCKKKVGMIILKCKCGHIFCQSHLNAHSHNCTYDYKKEKKESLEKNNPKLGQKMVKI